LESASQPGFEKNIKAFIQADCNLIVSLGTLVEEIKIAASANPEQKFMIQDFPIDPLLNNVWIQLYKTDQAAFLAGYVAASVTKTAKVGIFGGLDIPQVTDFMDGFALGVAYYNQKNGTNVEVIGWDAQKHIGLFVGGFCCTTEGSQMAQRLLNAGADIVLPVAGESIGWGAGAAVQEHGDALLIGVDADWTETAPEFADILLTSIEKHYDVSVVQAVQSILDGVFIGGLHYGSLETGEVDLSPFHNLDALVSDKVKADLEKIKADIIAGKLKTRP
jgi:basic membrane protein A